MKNTIKYFAIAVLATASITACTLEREDYTEISTDNFFKSETDVQLAVNSLYNHFNTNWAPSSTTNPWDGLYSADVNSGYPINTEFTTDAMRCTWGWGTDEMWLHNWYADKSSQAMNIIYNWFVHYTFLSVAQNCVNKIEACNLSDDIKTRYIAEARCLRGWMALVLYDLFGPVPVASNEVLDDPETLVDLPRLSEEEYTAMVEADLNYAIDNLPTLPAERGRMTAGAARMILLKYYMIQRNFAKALPLARALATMESEGVYTLLGDYNSVFEIANAGNKELILYIPCNVNYMPNYWIAATVPTNYPYPVAKASNWGAFRIPWEFYDTYEAGDARLKNIVDEYTATDGTLVTRGTGELAMGAIPFKYGIDPNQSGSSTANDVVVFRFADVLLSLAECINETSGAPTAEAIALVNRVRARAKLNELPATATASKEAFNDAILAERGHEFYAEGLRRQDLIRHGKFVSLASTRPENQTAEHKTRFPIPVWFITESHDVIIQNTGY